MPHSKNWGSFEASDDDDEEQDFLSESRDAADDWLARSPLAPYLKGANPLDPLSLIPLCAARVQEGGWIVDLAELVRNTLARVALDCDGFDPGEGLQAWLKARIDATLRTLLREDAEAERRADNVGSWAPHFMDLEITLGLEPGRGRLAAVVLNGLEPLPRRTFYELCILQRPLHELVGNGTTLAQVQAQMQVALRAIEAALPGRVERPHSEQDPLFQEPDHGGEVDDHD